MKSAMEIMGDPRWIAVLERDAKADGLFVYSVRTTGVYCRPSCPSRPARRENVAFHATAEDAREAGFRPCLRCNPDRVNVADPRKSLVVELCRIIETAEHAPTLTELANRAGLSAWHMHRVFKSVTGLTPKAYAAAHRAARVRSGLEGGRRVIDAIYDAGYGSNSRFYAEADSVLGMTARDYRAGGADASIRFAVGQCSLGSILVAQSTRGVCAILLGDDPEMLVHQLQERFPAAELVGGDVSFERLVAQVVGFVEAPKIGLDLPLDVRGTAFQERVWQALRKIPVGGKVSYAELARRIGAPRAVRAVAGACAANTIAVAIPCHRVVRSDGGLSGYRWGISRKRALLAREADD